MEKQKLKKIDRIIESYQQNPNGNVWACYKECKNAFGGLTDWLEPKLYDSYINYITEKLFR